MTTFRYLFSPIKIGAIEVKNRIVLPAHSTLYKRGGDTDVAYLEARARGGAGLIILEVAMVAPVRDWFVEMPGLYDESGVLAHRKIADALHRHGAKVFVQIGDLVGWAGPSVSSSVPSAWLNTQSREITIDEIEANVLAYGRAAANAKAAGIDGVQLHASHGVGIHQYISPLWNKRSDKYGGSLEKRMTYLLEIVDAVRAQVGPDYVVGARIDVDESMLGGNTLEDGVRICKILAETGKIDFLDIDAAAEPHQSHMVVASMYFPQGYMLYSAAAVREVVEPIPVIGVGRITSPEFAEQALADGKVDLVAMCRALIADPELPNKARRGEVDEIRACIGDIEGCYGRAIMGMPMGCSVNPDVGQELQAGLKPADKKKRVVVIGAGVAGMEAAVVAAQRGHDVTLIEKDAALGGHVRMVAKLPGRSDTSDIIRWLGLQLEKLKVDVRLNTLATPELIKSLKPDTVVVSTGSNYTRDGLSPGTLRVVPGAEADYVVTPEDIIGGKKDVGQHVVIYDDTGYVVGPGLAEMLADQGKSVEFVTSHPLMAAMLMPSHANVVLNTRVLPKASVLYDHALMSIDNHTVSFINPYTIQMKSIQDVDTVVLVTAKQPNEELYHALLGEVAELHIIGDARMARLGTWAIQEAIKDGMRVAQEL